MSKYSRAYSSLRQLVLIMRNLRCELCGHIEGERQQDKLHLHHLIKRRLWKEGVFEMDNILLVCQPCHVWVEDQPLMKCQIPKGYRA